MTERPGEKTSTKCEVELTKYAIEDLENLPDEILDEVETYLDKLEDNMYLGLPLYNRKDYKLKGCRKIYIGDRTYRIVYQVIQEKVYVTEIGEVQEEVANIARVVSIGLRENKIAYKNAHERIAASKVDEADNKDE
ncbi:type II toxin-antitoxin system RelE family toxin [Paraclostridium sordellii]|uniref:type II toxin-antitoxin system RelE family toxin n=1 Tax=Paraclostridium sordellii TaxID=1505 RepID=UPI000E5414CE|nr:type II toxin-antitoxin system RelE/ParE family toxin [Paeniclostridium sordellii]RGX00349.1 type II toxin-antitoxin system RelE/ParE family toxin [Paeniclostridium sordellii]